MMPTDPVASRFASSVSTLLSDLDLDFIFLKYFQFTVNMSFYENINANIPIKSNPNIIRFGDSSSFTILHTWLPYLPLYLLPSRRRKAPIRSPEAALFLAVASSPHPCFVNSHSLLLLLTLKSQIRPENLCRSWEYSMLKSSL